MLRDLWGTRPGHGASVVALVKVLQHGGVGPLKQPLLAQGRRVACVHEDPPFARAAVDAAVADGVIQAFVLQKNERSISTIICSFPSRRDGFDGQHEKWIALKRFARRDSVISPFSNDRYNSESLREAHISKIMVLCWSDLHRAFVFFLSSVAGKQSRKRASLGTSEGNE